MQRESVRDCNLAGADSCVGQIGERGPIYQRRKKLVGRKYNLAVFFDAFFLDRFGYGDHSVLNRPANQNLGGRSSSWLGHSQHRFFFQYQSISQWTITLLLSKALLKLFDWKQKLQFSFSFVEITRLKDDIVLSTKVPQFFRVLIRMKLALVHLENNIAAGDECASFTPSVWMFKADTDLRYDAAVLHQVDQVLYGKVAHTDGAARAVIQ